MYPAEYYDNDNKKVVGDGTSKGSIEEGNVKKVTFQLNDDELYDFVDDDDGDDCFHSRGFKAFFAVTLTLCCVCFMILVACAIVMPCIENKYVWSFQNTSCKLNNVASVDSYSVRDDVPVRSLVWTVSYLDSHKVGQVFTLSYNSTSMADFNDSSWLKILSFDLVEHSDYLYRRFTDSISMDYSLQTIRSYIGNEWSCVIKEDKYLFFTDLYQPVIDKLNSSMTVTAIFIGASNIVVGAVVISLMILRREEI